MHSLTSSHRFCYCTKNAETRYDSQQMDAVFLTNYQTRNVLLSTVGTLASIRHSRCL